MAQPGPDEFRKLLDHCLEVDSLVNGTTNEIIEQWLPDEDHQDAFDGKSPVMCTNFQGHFHSRSMTDTI